MSEDNKNEIPNVPDLRFPKFYSPWNKTSFGKITTVFSGGTPSSGIKEFYNGNIPFIRSGEINNDQTELFLSEKGLNNSSAKLVSKGDLLLALYGATSGEIAISKIDGAINQAILCIKSEENIVFLKHLWKSRVKDILKTYLQGGQGNLSAAIFRSINIFIPKLDEQVVLSDFFEKIELRIITQKKIIDNLNSLIKSIYALLLQNSPNEILSNICEIKKGEQLNSNSFDENAIYPVINGGINPSGHTSKYNCKNKITISEGGNSCGYVNYFEGEFWSGGHNYTLNQKITFNYQYLYHYLKYKEPQLMTLRVGSGLPNIQKSSLSKFPIYLPNIDKQDEYVKMFSSLSNKIDIEKSILQLYLRQKEYFLSKLFI